jgi:hypothetical protein
MHRQPHIKNQDVDQRRRAIALERNIQLQKLERWARESAPIAILEALLKAARLPRRSAKQPIGDLSLRPLGAPPSERVNGSRSGEGFATVPQSLRNEIFFPRVNRDARTVDNQHVAALNDDHVSVEVVDVRRGGGGLVASPECHLTAIRSIEYVAFDARRRLTTGGNFVRGIFHELWKRVHGFSFRLRGRTSCTT